MQLISLSKDEATEAVRRYNECFGEMEKVLGCLAIHVRENLRKGESGEVAEALVWTLRSWWGVQGPPIDTRAKMAQAMLELSWREEVFQHFDGVPTGADALATEFVSLLVEKTRSLGSKRREVSLASKVLHWILPWHVPVFDSYVCKELGVRVSSDLLKAYREVARLKVAAAGELASWGTDWLGEIGPRSSLRALDKCLWWQGGGRSGTAVVKREPWNVVDQLGLAHATY